LTHQVKIYNILQMVNDSHLCNNSVSLKMKPNREPVRKKINCLISQTNNKYNLENSPNNIFDNNCCLP
jgi:hypothetical protein